MSACPDRELLLQGLLDGELDAANTLSMETHLRTCPGCAAEYEHLTELRGRLRSTGVRYTASDALRARITGALESAGAGSASARPPGHSSSYAAARASTTRGERIRLFLAPWLFGGSMAAVALVLGFVLFVRVPSQGIASELVASHVRSLLAAHLIDVETSDRHVVKPWFAGKVDFAPPVIDLTDAGFALAGGRLDYLHDRVVAAVVYRRRQHVINLFVWPVTSPGTGAPRTERRDGYNLIGWTRGGLRFWAVSDLDPTELEQFHAILVARTAS